MAIETKNNLNGNGKGPSGAYHEAVPEHANGKAGTPVPHSDVAPWQRVQIARHPDRPHTLEYIQRLCTDFIELHGDRLSGDDASIIGGIAVFDGQTVMVIGHQKGRTTKENLARNFGMPQPSGYRKAQRLMDHAARFGFPVLTFIDTPGANPSMQSEEHGIGQSIAESLVTMLNIEVPIIATVIGEGGSGGALAIGLGDRVLMLENAIYSVATPEASAAILWHDAGKANEAAEAMRITSFDLKSFGIIDEIISEPDGGAHTDSVATLETVREAISRNLAEVQSSYALHTKKGARKLLEDRREKYERMGAFTEISLDGQESPEASEEK